MEQRPRETPADLAEVLPILGRVSILGGLDEAQLQTVLGKMRRARFPAGTRIFEQGGRPDCIYVIRRGRVKIVVDVDARPMELVEYGAGQCFGETSAIGILPHSATALALEDTEALVLPVRAVHELYREDPALFGILMLNIAREACRRLHKTDEIMLHYAARKGSG